MKTTERFNRVYKALSQAYFNGELEKGDCNKCAVGNIFREYGCIEATNPRAITSASNWKFLFVTDIGDLQQYVDVYKPINYTDEQIEEYKSCAIQTIMKTGYSVKEMARIENIFETSTPDNSDEGQYKGLCAVVEYLLSLDNTDEVTVESYKSHLGTKLQLQTA